MIMDGAGPLDAIAARARQGALGRGKAMTDEAAEIAKLQKDLDELKARRPEHCSGREGFVSAHQASAELLEKIDDLEEKIRDLREKARRGGGRPP